MERRERRLASWSGEEREGPLPIGLKIRRMRQERGLSLTVLAARAGIAKSYLSNIERQVQSNPSMLFLEKVSRVFGVEVESLVTDEGASAALDPDWAELVHKAIDMGINKEEFRTFIEFKRFQNWLQEQEAAD